MCKYEPPAARPALDVRVDDPCRGGIWWVKSEVNERATYQPAAQYSFTRVSLRLGTYCDFYCGWQLLERSVGATSEFGGSDPK